MSILKRIFSALTDSDNPVSEPVKPAEPIIENKVEESTPTPEDKTGIISNFTCEGGIKVGTQITVSDGQLLVALKDGNIIDLMPTGMYVVNEENASKLATSSLYYISLMESDRIRWGTTNPINFTDAKYGNLSLRVRGAYSYKVADPIKFITDCMNAGRSISVDDYIRPRVITAVEKIIFNNNGTSYTELPKAINKNLIRDELADTGINVNVFIEMIDLTEDSKTKIKNAMY